MSQSNPDLENTGIRIRTAGCAPEGVATRPNLPIAQALADAVRSTLEVMFFVDVVPEATSSRSGSSGSAAEAEWLSLRVAFHGTRTGLVTLAIHPSLAAYCHEGFQPTDAFDDFSDGPWMESSDDSASPDCSPTRAVWHSMLELGNIVCGSFLSNTWPEGLFRVEEPTLVSESPGLALRDADPAKASAAPALAFAASCSCQTTEGPLIAKVYLDTTAI